LNMHYLRLRRKCRHDGGTANPGANTVLSIENVVV